MLNFTRDAYFKGGALAVAGCLVFQSSVYGMVPFLTEFGQQGLRVPLAGGIREYSEELSKDILNGKLKEIIAWAEEGKRNEEVMAKLEGYIERVHYPDVTAEDRILSWASLIALQRVYHIRMKVPALYCDVDGEKFKKMFDDLLEEYPSKKNLMSDKEEIEVFCDALGEIRDYLGEEYRNDFGYPAICEETANEIYKILERHGIKLSIVGWADRPVEKPYCYFAHAFLIVTVAGIDFVLDPTAEQFERLDNNTIFKVSPVIFPINTKPSIHPSLVEIDILPNQIRGNNIIRLIYGRTLSEYRPYENKISFKVRLDTSDKIPIPFLYSEEVRQGVKKLFEALRARDDEGVTEILNPWAENLGTKTKIVYANGCVKGDGDFTEELVEHLEGIGKKVLLVICENSNGLGNTDIVCRKLRNRGFEVVLIDEEGISREKLYAEVVDKKIAEFEKNNPGFNPNIVIGLGGGVAMDFAKAVAIAMGHKKPFVDFIPWTDSNKPYEKVTADMMFPCVLIPTIPCTSAEISRKVIVGCKIDGKIQEGLTAKDLPHPTLAIIDPMLGETIPSQIFSQSISDIMSAAVEYAVYYGVNEDDEELQKRGLIGQLTSIKFLVEILPLLERYAQGEKDLAYQISEYLYFAELLKGMGIANTLLPHRLSYPLKKKHDISHNIAVSVGLFSWVEKTALLQQGIFSLIGEVFYPEIQEFDNRTKAIRAYKGIQDYLDRISSYWSYEWPDFEELKNSIPEMAQDVLRSRLLTEDPLGSREDIQEIVSQLYEDGVGRVEEREYLTFEALKDDPQSLLAGSAEAKVKDRIEIAIPAGESLLETLHSEVKRRNIKRAYIEKVSGNLSEVEFRNLKWFPPSGIITDKDRLFVYKENAKLEELKGHIFPDKDGKPVIHAHFSATPSGENTLGGHLTDKTVAGKGVVITLAVLEEDTPIVAGRNIKTGQDDVFFPQVHREILDKGERTIHARVKEDVNLLEGIKEVIERHNIQNGEIVYCIGALKSAIEKEGDKEINRPLELVSLKGKISRNGDGRLLIDADFSASTIEGDEVIAVKGNLSEWTFTTGIKVVISIRVSSEKDILDSVGQRDVGTNI